MSGRQADLDTHGTHVIFLKSTGCPFLATAAATAEPMTVFQSVHEGLPGKCFHLSGYMPSFEVERGYLPLGSPSGEAVATTTPGHDKAPATTLSLLAMSLMSALCSAM